MRKKTVEIKLGNVVYQVEREFVGAACREELLIRRLVDDMKNIGAQSEDASAIEKLRKNGCEQVSIFEPGNSGFNICKLNLKKRAL